MNSTVYVQLARILANTIGTALVMLGVLRAEDAGQLVGNGDFVMILTGLIGIVAQYVGFWLAKRAADKT